jgi:hypothetical protein
MMFEIIFNINTALNGCIILNLYLPFPLYDICKPQIGLCYAVHTHAKHFAAVFFLIKRGVSF